MPIDLRAESDNIAEPCKRRLVLYGVLRDEVTSLISAFEYRIAGMGLKEAAWPMRLQQMRLDR